MNKDYYKIIGVDKNASKEEIKQAYRKLAHQHHPDKGGDEKRFKEINEAYQVLSDSEKRQQYDQFSAFGGPAGGWGTFEGFQGGQPGWEDLFSSFGQGFSRQTGFRGHRINLEDLFSDIFGDIFTGGVFSRKRPKGKNIVINMEVGLEEVLKGIEREIKIEDLGIKLKIKVKIPKKASKEIQELIERLKKEGKLV